MKVLLAVDESAYSDRATNILRALQLPSETEVTVITVVPEHTLLGGVGLHILSGMAVSREQARESQQQKAAALLQEPVEALRAAGLKAEGLVRQGRTAEEILKMAAELAPHLVVIGAKGAGGPHRFPLGSVTYTVMTHVGSSVLLARERTAAVRRVLLAIDGSEHSDSLVRFLLDMPLHRSTELTVVSALQSWAPALVKLVTKEWEVDQHILLELQRAEEERAHDLLTATRKRFEERGYEVSPMILKGEAADQILATAETLNPDLIAFGARGLTRIEGLLLGNVAQRLARFSRHSVLIGKVHPVSYRATSQLSETGEW